MLSFKEIEENNRMGKTRDKKIRDTKGTFHAKMGKQWKQCQTLFLGSKITADGDCSHEIKRHSLEGKL